MRISASGLQSTIVVAIDQILRLAPSISGPIEPVVSSTNTTSTTGLRACRRCRRASTAPAANASTAACAMCLSMDVPSRKRRRPARKLRALRVAAAPELRRRHRRNSRKNWCVARPQRRVRCGCEPRYECDHESRRQTHAQHLAGGRRPSRRRHRPDAAAAPLRHNPARNARRCGARHRHHAGARRAADRRDRGLRHLPRAAQRTPPTRLWSAPTRRCSRRGRPRST